MIRLRQWWCGLWWNHTGMAPVRKTATGRVYRCPHCGKERFIATWDRDMS